MYRQSQEARADDQQPSGMTRRSWSWGPKQAEVGRREKQEWWAGLGAYTSWSFVFPGHAPGLTEVSFPMCKTIHFNIHFRKLLYLSIKPYEIEIWSMRSIWILTVPIDPTSESSLRKPSKVGTVIQTKMGRNPLAYDRASCPSR